MLMRKRFEIVPMCWDEQAQEWRKQDQEVPESQRARVAGRRRRLRHQP